MKFNGIESLLKKAAKKILPAPITATMYHYMRADVTPRKYWGKCYPALAGKNIVQEAKQHLKKSLQIATAEEMPISNRWRTYTAKIRKDIGGLASPKAVIYYAQSRIGFDHRITAHNLKPYLGLQIRMLKNELRHFTSVIDTMGESAYSRADSLLKYQGRLVSNVFLYHLRSVLLCLSHVKEPATICEIGGGYGGAARIWLGNPVYHPRCYINVDFPESLFFAEVFLRVNFRRLKLLYVTGIEKITPEIMAQYSVILCPIEFVGALAELRLDLVINTGSLQEMTEEWVDFWMQWLSRQDCHWFYSLNMFAQPLGNMVEGKNTWSPRLGPEWITRHQEFTPSFVRIQGSRNFAEILAEGQLQTVDQWALFTHYRLTKKRVLSCQILLEAMDIVRQCYDEGIMWDLLQRCTTEMCSVPKEALYLANYLTEHSSLEFRSSTGGKLQEIYQQLNSLRCSGKEDTV